MKKINQLSDKDLYAMCKKWGAEALAARRKFAGLLPEVYRRERESSEQNGRQNPTPSPAINDNHHQQSLVPINGLRKTWLEKRGYTCIYEFAARLAGMSRKQVDLVMSLDKRFAGTPVLHAALVEGEISANKLARVASIATVENQTELLRKTEILSSRALEIYVRELKMENENQDGLNKTKNDQKVLHVHQFDSGNDSSHDTLFDTRTDTRTDARHDSSHDTPPDADILAAFSPQLKQKIRELKAKGIDVNSLFMEFLQKREHEISEKMDELGREQLQERGEKNLIGKPSSRHVPAIIKRIVTAKYGNVCAAEGCGKPAAHLHHERRFSAFGSHDPRYLRPLCKAHHELMHAEESPSKKGMILLTPFKR